MAETETERERHDRLRDAIRAAEERLAYRRDLKYAEAGTFLKEASRELDALGFPEGDASRASEYDRIEARLKQALDALEDEPDRPA
jgi:hypothetical protein